MSIKERVYEMRYFKYIRSLMLAGLSAVILTTSAVYIEQAEAQPTQVSQAAASSTNKVYQVSPLMVVNAPSSYLNKTVLMKAKFDKFSTLGLDYKPAFRSSDDYISFLIKRDDTTHDIPLSEMKLFLTRTEAEKFIDLKTNDEVEIKGVVFSDALGDTWVDVKQLTITKKAPDTDDNNGVK